MQNAETTGPIVETAATSESIRILQLRDDVSKIDWYHTIELSETLVTRGRYDWRPYIETVCQFMGPLEGKTILDVGTGNGFFAFEFEKRGAIVTGIDIPDQADRDNNSIGVGNIKRGITYSNYDFKKPFYIAKDALNSKINRIETNLYDMTPASLGVFDIVFCNDVLLHLTDPIRALWVMKKICREQLVVGTPIINVETLSTYPIAEYHGAMNSGEFWIPNLKCLEQMVLGCGLQDIGSGVIVLNKEHNEMSELQRIRGFVKGLIGTQR